MEFRDLFAEVWGIVPAYSVPGPPSVNELADKAGVGKFQINAKDEGSDGIYSRRDAEKSWMGLDILFPFTIGGEQLKYFDRTGTLKRKMAAEFLVPAATLVDFSRQKEIIKTKMSAGYGTVKELYSFGDWRLNIRGLLFDERKEERTAVELRRRLLAFEAFADSIPVKGWIFNEMKIDRIVIGSIRLRQVQGKPWVIPFEMECDSDASPELLI